MDYSKLKNKPFMLINFIYQPAPGENTSKKNWGEVSKWQTKEEIFFVDRLNAKHLTDYTVVIDLLNAVVLKHRFEDTSKGEIYAHFVNKYKKDVMKAIDAWRQKRGVDLLKNQPNVEKAITNAMENVTVNGEDDMIVLEKQSNSTSEMPTTQD
jgi:hypothetical protein